MKDFPVKYGLMADVHLHNWTFASHLNDRGINNRLQFLLDDISRCAAMTVAGGGKALVVAGDLFHVRGSVAPSVLNPTKERFEQILSDYPELTIYILAGNHDMEFRTSSSVGNSVQALASERCRIINKPCYVPQIDAFMAPWEEDMDALKSIISHEFPMDYDGVDNINADLILHAPIDGVIGGLPPHGLTPEWLADCGYKRVFSGHYHNHKSLGGHVYSIGALAHHTWNDVGTTAGFMLIGHGRDEVRQVASHAPEFYDLDVTEFESEAEMGMAVANTYTRVKLPKTRAWEQEQIREGLLRVGARAVTFNVVKERVLERDGDSGSSVSASVAAGASVEVSVSEFIASKSEFSGRASQISAAALQVLAEVA